jgi:phage repressor protein C with HTH and peptisase S24 domain
MLPTLQPGDQVMVLRWFPAHRGQVVVAKLGNNFIIKRLDHIAGEEIRLISDNPEVGGHLKPIRRSDLVGVVFFVRRREEKD